MLDVSTRTAILRLREAGHGARRIAKDLGLSRSAVRGVIESGTAEVPQIQREQRLTGQEERLGELFLRCKGNLSRVHEILVEDGVSVSYATVTRFCRDLGLGRKPKTRVGRYEHEPGGEMQHDTSPHTIEIDGREVAVQCASLTLAFSRMRYIQVYPRWNRLRCRQFLSDGIVALGGAAGTCVVDNSSVVLKSGSGKDAIPSPEMEALGKRFGFGWLAHELGDPDRKASVERSFSHVEGNFYAGRAFRSIEDCNAQALLWCEKKSREVKRELKASPLELWQRERLHLKPLPLHIPEVYECHERKVDVESYVSLHSNRYPVPERWIGKSLEIREEVDRIVIQHGHAVLLAYKKEDDGARVRLPWPKAWSSRSARASSKSPEEDELRRLAPALMPMVALLRARYGGRGRRGVRRLLRIWEEYPSDAVHAAVSEAVAFGMSDLGRLEAMVLRRVATDYFNLEDDDDA